MHATIFGNVTALVQRLYGTRKSDHQTKSDCQTIFFTIDVVTQLAQLVQVDDMGDEEVEHVVTSLASLKIKIKT